MKKLIFYTAGFVVLLIFIFLPVASINILSWYKWYKIKSVMLVIDIDRHSCGVSLSENYTKLTATKLGIVSTDISNLCNKKIFPIPNHKFILKVYDVKYDIEELQKCVDQYKNQIFSIVYIDEDLKKIIQYEPSTTICLSGQARVNIRKISKDEVYNINKQNKFFVLNFESYHNNPCDEVLPLRTFLVDLNLVKSLNDTQLHSIILKIKKAVFERSCSVVYILPSEYIGFEDNLKLVTKIVKEVKIPQFSEVSFVKFKSYGSKVFVNLVTIIVAIFIPLLMYRFATVTVKKNNPYLVYFSINLLTIFLGMFIWGVNQRYEYISLEDNIRGIKLMFVLPVLIAPFVILERDELKQMFNSYLRFKHIFLFLIFLFLFIYITLRTENVSKKLLLPFELQLRQIIETYILFRPRFKELLTQPLLFLSLNLLKDSRFLFVKIMFCFSIISLTSIINTFLHTHTPVWLCVLRSLTSMVIGLLFGIVLTYVIYRNVNRILKTV